MSAHSLPITRWRVFNRVTVYPPALCFLHKMLKILQCRRSIVDHSIVQVGPSASMDLHHAVRCDAASHDCVPSCACTTFRYAMLSPQTIFLSDDFKAKTLLIPVFPGAESSKTHTLPALGHGTVAKSVLPFLAPELVRKTEKTTASDVFSFAMLLWHLFKPSNVVHPGKPMHVFSHRSNRSLCLSPRTRGRTCARNPSLARRPHRVHARFPSSVPMTTHANPECTFIPVPFRFSFFPAHCKQLQLVQIGCIFGTGKSNTVLNPAFDDGAETKAAKSALPALDLAGQSACVASIFKACYQLIPANRTLPGGDAWV